MSKPASDLVPAPGCRRCPRLAGHRRSIARQHPEYFGAPVTAWGSASSARLIVGLAPGLHGAHRTGVPFWGDASGDLLHAVLSDAGFATPAAPGQSLRITNAVKCLPPGNRPTGQEVRQCARFLQAELRALPRPGCVLALGRTAFEATLRALELRLKDYPFAHGAEYETVCGLRLLASYHPSRYNVNTGRINQPMLAAVVARL